MDSSRRGLGGFLLGGFTPVLAVFLLFVEGATLASSLLRFRWEAGVVKKEDMVVFDLSIAPKAKIREYPHSICRYVELWMSENIFDNVSAVKSWRKKKTEICSQLSVVLTRGLSISPIMLGMYYT